MNLMRKYSFDEDSDFLTKMRKIKLNFNESKLFYENQSEISTKCQIIRQDILQSKIQKKVQINQGKILPQANIQTKYLINQAIQKESQPQKIVNSQSQQKSMQSSSNDHTKNNPLKLQTNQGPIEQQQEQYQFQQDLPSMQFQINFEQQQPKGQERRSSLQNDMINTKMEKKELFKEFADDWRQSGNYRESGKFQGQISKRYSRKVEHNLKNGEFVFAQDSDLQKGQSNTQEKIPHNQTNQSSSQPQQQPNPLQTNTQPAKSTFLSLSQFQSQHRLYQEYQPHNDPQSSSESESSLDSEASFAKMNARRTMLLSDDFYGMNQYMTISNQLSSEQCKQAVQCCRKINNLQSLLKRETILLEFQEKTKNERIKQIQYSYVNAFNNFLVLRNLKTSKTQTKPILLSAKDLYQIHQEFLDDLRRIKQALGNIILPQQQSEELQLKKTLSSSRFIPQSPTKIKNFGQLFQPINPSTLPPPQTFLIDFNNFFPNWSQNIYHLMQLEFQSHQRIESTFQSEYSIPSKIFSSIKYRDNITRFCEMIFEQPLRELKSVKEELIVDYANIYEKWASTLFNIPNSNPLKQFMEGRYMLEDTASRNAIVPQISKFFGEKMDPSEYEKLLIELNHFAKNRNAMNFLFNEIGRQEIQGQNINLRLALLVYKKMQINRRKLQQLALLFINQIIDNYPDMPLEIKYIVQLFKHFSKQKLIQQNLEPVIKYQDLKSFFNKIIFSQLFFLTFMQLVDEQGPNSGKEKSSMTGMNSQGHNITMIALIAQKIMFGQEFYERFKYGYFNSVIKEYAPKIKTFIENFAQTQTIRFEQPKEIQFTLLSLQSVKYLYLVLKQNEIIQPLVSFQTRLLPTLSHHPFSLGSSRYTLQKMYLMLTYKPEFNYTAVFRPKDKFRRTFIEFLMLIESINDGVTFRQVLEQYKCMQEDNHQGAKPSVQIYANYLAGYEKIIQSQNLVQDIQLSITKTKAYIEKVKIFLQREHNISMNLEHIYQTLLVQKKKLTSTELLEDYINLLFNLPLQFDYFVHDGKICENESTSSKKKQRIIKDCLNDVADFFGKGLEGLDGLYSLLIEKIIEEVEKQGVVDQNMIETAQSIIGQKLYKMVKLGSVQTEKDKKLFNSMKRHKFLNLKMLALPQYIDEQEIILQLSLQILERLKHPMSPDRMMQCFYEVSIVFQNVITCVGKASDITSDVQIPLMQLVLVKSMIPNLNTILEFIKTFSHNESGSNKYAMILALVESICYLIQNMDAEHLGISQAQYVGYIQNEYVIVD